MGYCMDCGHCKETKDGYYCEELHSKPDAESYCVYHFEPKSVELEQKPEKTEEPVKDMVNHPAHYTQGGIECIDAIKAAVTGLVGIEAVCTGNIIRYIWRWKYKNGLEDLKKCRWYLDRLIKEVDHD